MMRYNNRSSVVSDDDDCIIMNDSADFYNATQKKFTPPTHNWILDDPYHMSQDKDKIQVHELYRYLREHEDHKRASMVHKYIHRDIFSEQPYNRHSYQEDDFEFSEDYLLQRDGPLTDKRHFSNQNRTRRMYHKNKLFTKKSQETINLKAKLSRTNLKIQANALHNGSNNNAGGGGAGGAAASAWINETPPDLVSCSSHDSDPSHSSITPPSLQDSSSTTSDEGYSPPSSTHGTPPPPIERPISIPKRRSRVQLDQNPEPGMPHPEKPDLDQRPVLSQSKSKSSLKSKLTPSFGRKKPSSKQSHGNTSSSHKRSKSVTTMSTASKPKLRNRLSVANLFSSKTEGEEYEIGGDVMFDALNGGVTKDDAGNALRISFPSQASRPPVPEIPKELLDQQPPELQEPSVPVQSSASPITPCKEFDFLLDNSGQRPPKPSRLYELEQQQKRSTVIESDYSSTSNRKSVDAGLPPKVPPHRTLSMLSDSPGVPPTWRMPPGHPNQVTMRLSSIATGASSRQTSLQRTPSMPADKHPDGNDIYTRKCSFIRRRNSVVARSMSVSSSNYGASSLPPSPTTAANTAANRTAQHKHSKSSFMLPGYDETKTKLQVINQASPKPSVDALGLDKDTLQAVDDLKKHSAPLPRTRGRLGKEVKSCYDLNATLTETPPPPPSQSNTSSGFYYYGLELFDSNTPKDRYGYLWNDRGQSFMAKIH